MSALCLHEWQVPHWTAQNVFIITEILWDSAHLDNENFLKTLLFLLRLCWTVKFWVLGSRHYRSLLIKSSSSWSRTDVPVAWPGASMSLFFLSPARTLASELPYFLALPFRGGHIECEPLAPWLFCSVVPPSSMTFAVKLATLLRVQCWLQA